MHQRATGHLALAFRRRGPLTVLARLRQDGALKARFPQRRPAEWAEAVTLNTTGGVAGGDSLAIDVEAAPSTRVTIATQAAERFYRALPGSTARVRTTLRLDPGATLEWLPQETILFDACALQRTLTVDLAPDAAFTGVESLIFGRTAMGERLDTAAIDDLVELRRGGERLLHDRIRLHGPAAAILARPATGGGARAVGTIIHAAPGAEAHLDPLRAALAPFDAGASSWDGLLLARIVAENGACLRRATVAGLSVLRAGRPLPRVWSC